jgi:hypothetical protein
MYALPLGFDYGLLSKEDAMHKLAQLVCVVDAESILIVSESWKAPAGCRPSEHSGRKEVLSAVFAQRGDTSVTAIADILRDPDGSYAGIGEIAVSRPMAYDLLFTVFERAAELQISRADKRRMRRELMRLATPVERPTPH